MEGLIIEEKAIPKIDRKEFLKMILAVVLPISMQYLIATTLNMADTVMVSSLGDAAIAAVGLINQYVYFFYVIIFGLSTGAAIFLAQYYGRGKLDHLNKQFTVLVILSLIFGTLFTIISLAFTNDILNLLSPDLDVQDQARNYLYVVAFTFTISAISFAITTTYRSVGQPKAPVKISIIAFFTNVFFNYLFIFGKFGCPALGVTGAAVGTLISRIVEFVLLISLIIKKDNVFKFDLKYLELANKAWVMEYIKVAVPVLIAETLWSLSQLIYSVSYSWIGKEAAAAIQVTNTLQNVFFILVNSTASGAGVIIGQSLGKGDMGLTQAYAKEFIKIITVIGLVSAAILVFLPEQLLMIYGKLDPGLHDLSVRLIIIRGLFIIFRFMNGLLVIGIFRGGGDSRVPLVIEIITTWVYAVPVCVLGSLYLKWSVEIVFILVSIEEVLKFIGFVFRYRQKKWLNQVA